jgi:hypothetical protein
LFLEKAGIDGTKIDYITFYEKPLSKYQLFLLGPLNEEYTEIPIVIVMLNKNKQIEGSIGYYIKVVASAHL